MSKVGRNEKVLDMFSGIGQLCIPMAVHAHPQSICAIELNSVAFGYLQQNITLNNVDGIVRPILGNCADVTPKEQFDRVLMDILRRATIFAKHFKLSLPVASCTTTKSSR